MSFKEKLLATLKKLGENIDELTTAMKKHDEKAEVHYKTTEALEARLEMQEAKAEVLVNAIMQTDPPESTPIAAEEGTTADSSIKIDELADIVARLSDDVITLTRKANDRSAFEECATRAEALAERLTKLEAQPVRTTQAPAPTTPSAPAMSASEMNALLERITALENRKCTVPEAPPAPEMPTAELDALGKRISTLENRKPAPPPAPPTVDLSGFEKRIGQIEKAVEAAASAAKAAAAAPATAPEAPDLSDIYGRLASIEKAHDAAKEELEALAANLEATKKDIKRDMTALEEAMW